MKKALLAAIIGASIIACPLLYFFVGPQLVQNQLDTLKIIAIIAAVSALYCFIAGQLTNNNSQMDKLWSLLPEIYIWVVAAKSGFNPRIVIMAILATVWGIRLTINFGKKGAYKLKFWEGEEDYRWIVLKQKKEFQPSWKWAVFNLLFISVYQNALVLMLSFPAIVCMNSSGTLNFVDLLAAILMLLSILLETIADKQQWEFQTTKWKLIKSGKKLEELPFPYNKGFNTTGLWNHSRHPNYLGEQCIWFSLYIFSVAGGTGIFNWSIIGSLLLIVLFLGSSSFGEEISSSKYPEYADYKKTVGKYFSFKGYNN